MRDKLKQLIDDFCIDVPLGAWEKEHLVDYLLKSGVIAPPITIGQTVYTVIPADDEIDGGVFAEEVTGITYKGGKWYAIDTDGLALEVGSFDGCYLTREEAEKALRGGENDG